MFIKKKDEKSQIEVWVFKEALVLLQPWGLFPEG